MTFPPADSPRGDSTPAAPSPTRFASLTYVPPGNVGWGLPDAAGGLVVFLFTIGIVSVAAQFVPDSARDAAGFVLNLIGYGVLAGTAILASRRRGIGTLAADFGLRFRWVDLLLGLGIGVVAKLLVIAYSALAKVLVGYEPSGSNLTLSPDTLWLVLNGVIFTAIVAPIVEELYMRGLLLRSIRNAILRGWLGRRPQPAERPVQITAAVLAVALSALVFMLLHLWQSTDPALLIVLGLSTLTLGIFNGIAAIWTGRLGAGIIAHILFNGSSVLILLASGPS
ncbi:CPBP family intramembrane glutamic endopeptidase [Glaciihabitans sp. dw_435]|uniref:CPBP family intramembrane glutamic endopeptidase n=1 Tax=Glaciihabitans sp. dw_435 TaxID=2720081 RepID=UPI001BD45205|nr:CPBP family intramembrane glutamic endopeptidase [Glaciihabitans sp. dw_435]